MKSLLSLSILILLAIGLSGCGESDKTGATQNATVPVVDPGLADPQPVPPASTEQSPTSPPASVGERGQMSRGTGDTEPGANYAPHLDQESPMAPNRNATSTNWTETPRDRSLTEAERAAAPMETDSAEPGVGAAGGQSGQIMNQTGGQASGQPGAMPSANGTASSPTGSTGTATTPEALAGKRFVLKSYGGADASGFEKEVTLDFAEDLRVSGGVCNRFSGQAKLENGKLIAGQMASTKMMCANQDLNNLENRFGSMMSQGAGVRFDGKVLSLGTGDDVLIYEIREAVQP